jgi:hypothetical protein
LTFIDLYVRVLRQTIQMKDARFELSSNVIANNRTQIAVLLVHLSMPAPLPICAIFIATTWIASTQSSRFATEAGLGSIDIQDSHWEPVLIHCASDQLIRSAMHGEAVRAQ